MKMLMMIAVAFLAACDKAEFPLFNAKPFDAKPLEEKIEKLSNRVSILEAQISQIPTKPVSTETWVLWKRIVQTGYMFYTPFLSATAFESKSDCMNGARNLLPQGGTYLSNDPIVVLFESERWEFACLPKGVMAGLQPAK